MDIFSHNLLVLGSESPNIFGFALFGITILWETLEDLQKKIRELGDQQEILIIDITSHIWLI
jgi:vacuolar-type H+-ATPase subunit F/Vma7